MLCLISKVRLMSFAFATSFRSDCPRNGANDSPRLESREEQIGFSLLWRKLVVGCWGEGAWEAMKERCLQSGFGGGTWWWKAIWEKLKCLSCPRRGSSSSPCRRARLPGPCPCGSCRTPSPSAHCPLSQRPSLSTRPRVAPSPLSDAVYSRPAFSCHPSSFHAWNHSMVCLLICHRSPLSRCEQVRDWVGLFSSAFPWHRKGPHES